MTHLTETTCRTCGQKFRYEPVIIFGRDLVHSLHTNCERCTAKQKEHKSMDKARIYSNDLCRQWERLLPPDLRETSDKHPSFNRRLWKIVEQWEPQKENLSLGIIGPAARCKTRVMALLAQRVYWDAEDVRRRMGSALVWTSAVRLKDAATDRYSRDRQISTTAREHLDECRKTPWLFLDDFGKNEWSPTFESQLFQILDHRMNHQLPTVWSANAHPEDFAPFLSPLNAWPIIGRLLDRCTLLDLREE